MKINILDTQMNLVKNTAARAYIIPGNHDWMQGKPGGWTQVFINLDILNHLV